MHQFDGYELSFPVIGGKYHPNGKDIDIKAIIGTAFYIGNGFYFTAGHVIEQASSYEVSALGLTKSSKPWYAIKIEEYEVRSEIDLAIFRTQHQIPKAFPWEKEFVGNLTNIVTIGYPHALYVKDVSIYRRDFKGYVITRRPYPLLTSKPFIYELSIPCPKGLSGAFVLNDITGKICGVVIGSDKSDVDIHFETEERIEQLGKIIHHKTETSTYGIAVSSKQILELHFNLLGGTFESFLKTQNLFD